MEKKPVSKKGASQKEKCIQVCPICGSEKFTPYDRNLALESWGSSRNYICKRCGNIFPIPLEVCAKDIEQIRTDLKQAELTPEVLDDTPNIMLVPYGAFLIKFWYPFMGTLALILGIGFIAFNSYFLGIPAIFTGLVLWIVFLWKRKQANQPAN